MPSTRRRVLGVRFGLAMLAVGGAGQSNLLGSPALADGASVLYWRCTTDQTQACPANSTYPLPVTGNFTPSGTQDTNLKQVNGATVNVGAGAAGTGTQRVTTSTDSTIGTVTTITNAVTVAQPTAGNLNATVVGTGTFAVQSSTTPGSRTIITLDVKTVTTGGTAVTALTAGHRTAGGFLLNPVGATIALCINEIGTASGTTSSGDTTCIQAGQSYNLSPSVAAVSVITSDSAHPFSGYGLN